MLGLIVLATEGDEGLSPQDLLEDLLGVPVIARAIAGALPTEEPVAAVLVTTEELADRLQADVVERFGFDEIDRVITAGSGLVAGLQAGLSALGDDVDAVIVTSGARALAPLGLVDKVVARARAGEGAAPAIPLPGHIVAVEDDGVVPLDVRPRLRLMQGPQAFKIDVLKAALDSDVDPGASDCAGLVVAAGGSVSLLEGDADNLLLCGEADLGRAVEVFSRRAVDYAFVYPKDLLPEDPLASALAPGEDLGEGLGRQAEEHADAAPESEQQGA